MLRLNYIMVVLCATLSFSCQFGPKKLTSEDLLISEQVNLSSPATVTDSEAAADINFLIFALENAYGGRNYAPHGTYEEAVGRLKNVSGLTSVEVLRDRIDESLLLIPDSHLKAKLDGRPSQARLDKRRRPAVGKNAIGKDRKVWDARIDKAGRKKILYVSITRFPPYEDKVWSGLIPFVKANLAKADLFVLDMRGNSGGDDSIGMELAEVLFGHAFEYPVARQYVSRKPETLALRINGEILDLLWQRKQGAEIPDHQIERIKKYTREYNAARNGEIPPLWIRTNKGTGNRNDPVTGFTKPIFILMDAFCGSSCESTIAAFEWHPWVKRVGENTQGCTHFGNIGSLILPNSKIEIQMPTQYSEFFDKRFIENVGIAPEIKVAPGGDAYQTVIEGLSR